MAITFPSNPSAGDIFTSNGRSWQWDGSVWTGYGVLPDPTVFAVDSTNDRVGIGTSAPAYDLDVSGEVNASNDMRIAGVSLDGLIRSAMPVGSVIPFAGASSPDATWLVCDGSAVSRTTYAALFAVLGTTYGSGDGSTTFNIPNMGGRVPVGLDSGQTEFDALGETGGAKTHTLTASEAGVSSHSHTINGTFASSTHTHQHISPVGLVAGTLTIARPDDAAMDLDGSYDYRSIQTVNRGAIGTGTAATEVWRVTSTSPSTTATASASTTSASASDHNNLQPYVALNYIMKAA